MPPSSTPSNTKRPPMLLLQMGLQDMAAEQFRAVVKARQPELEMEVVVVPKEEVPRRPLREYAGIIISGSRFMVTERLAWSDRAGEWLREVIAECRNPPILGVCYGHQLLCQSLGGRVDYLDCTPMRQLGMAQYRLTEHASRDALFSVLFEDGARPSVTVEASEMGGGEVGRGGGEGAIFPVAHRQRVMSPPSDAVLLATRELDPYAALRLASNVWSVQFHPEMTPTFVKRIIEFQRTSLKDDGLDPDVLTREVDRLVSAAEGSTMNTALASGNTDRSVDNATKKDKRKIVYDGTRLLSRFVDLCCARCDEVSKSSSNNVTTVKARL